MVGFMMALGLLLLIFDIYCWFTLLWWGATSLYTRQFVSLSLFDSVAVVIGVVALIRRVSKGE